MNLRYKKMTAALALFVVFAVAQVYLGVSLAATRPEASSDAAGNPQGTGILATQGNKPITVNGASAVSGATIVSGALIETPDGVGATVTIPGHGTLQIAPNSKLTIDIDPSGNVKVTITQGCAVLNTKKGTTGALTNAQGQVSKAEASGDNVIDSCPGVKVAGAAAAGKGGLFGLGTAATVAIVAGAIGGTAAGFGLANRGTPASPSSP